MPRVKALRAEIGTTGIMETVSVSTAFYDVAEAVEKEHSCDSNTCDIGYALHNGFPYVAAAMLSSATEAPLVDLVCQFHGIPIHGDYRKLEGWDDWYQWFKENARECSCGSYVLDTDSTHCDNCGKEIPMQEEEARKLAREWACDESWNDTALQHYARTGEALAGILTEVREEAEWDSDMSRLLEYLKERRAEVLTR